MQIRQNTYSFKCCEWLTRPFYYISFGGRFWVINLAIDHMWLLSAGWDLEHLNMWATVYHVSKSSSAAAEGPTSLWWNAANLMCSSWIVLSLWRNFSFSKTLDRIYHWNTFCLAVNYTNSYCRNFQLKHICICVWGMFLSPTGHLDLLVCVEADLGG